MRKMMVDVNEIKKEREKIEEQFKASSMDMAATFLQALAADGFIDTEKISNKSLDEIYGPNLIECEESLKRQENLLAKIQVGWSLFFK